MPRSAWLAVGVAAGAAAVALGLPAILPLGVGLFGVAIGRSGFALVRGPRGVTATAMGIGHHRTDSLETDSLGARRAGVTAPAGAPGHRRSLAGDRGVDELGA